MIESERFREDTGVQMLQYCKKIPKVELHAHLNGSISPSTMQKLLSRHQGKLSHGTIPEMWQTTIAKGEKRTLNDCFAMFKIIHTIVDDEEAVAMVAHDVVLEFAADGVVYLELRSTPRANPTTGMTKQSYIDAVLKGIDSSLAKCSQLIHVRVLLSIDRRQSVSEARDTVHLAAQYSSALTQHRARVVGIDLSGDPNAGDMNELLPVLRLAKEKGLKLSLHLAEIPNRNDESVLLLSSFPDRIGHGTFFHPSVGGTDEIVRIVSDRRIPMEICLTSNVKGQTVPNYENHQLRFWREKNHPVIICTDDKGVFATSLSEEYHIATLTFSLNQDDVRKLSLEAVDAVFEEDYFKLELKKMWDSI